ncbi:MAG: hypothetical protein RLY95_17 [Pseudomonadota bacterium]|jgi:hypothetical protein
MKSNREKLKELIAKGNITQSKAAVLIAEETKRPCSDRSVRAWLADEGTPSARHCQDWVIHTLEARMRFLKLI